jgi:hypothetical protein
MGRKKKTYTEPTFPFGKYRGFTPAEVMRRQPSYLCWFFETVEGCEDVKKAIVTLPGFEEHLANYRERQRRREKELRQAPVSPFLPPGQLESEEMLARLCDQLFNGCHAVQTATELKIIQAVHYGKHIQSGENLYCEKAGDEQYRFVVHEDGREYEPWTVTPETDLSTVPLDILAEMDAEMSYCGETDDRAAKFSETRKHIQREMRERRSTSGFDCLN